MKKTRNCKIVQDLLPNYIEELTDGETNQYIEEHIGSCEECTKVLKEMNGEIQLDKINQNKEIKYLKKVKRRIGGAIAVIITLIILLIIVMKMFLSSIAIPGDDSNHTQYYIQSFKNWIRGTSTLEDYKVYSHMIIQYEEEYEGTKEGKRKCTYIISFDKNDICIGTRYSVEGYTEERLKQKYETSKDLGTMVSNSKIVEGRLVYNFNMFNRKSKEELNEFLKDKYPYKDALKIEF